MNKFCRNGSPSIGKKQVVAVTGLILVSFVIVHLAGNLLLYLGPEAFNGYAKKLAGLRPGLYLLEAGLIVLFLTHLWLTALLVVENLHARPLRYRLVRSSGKNSVGARLMPLTGTVIVIFVLWHLRDFTFTDHHGPRSVLSDGQSHGLYGVVYNSFQDPAHSLLYVIAMTALGLHLSHAIQSFVQTMGFNHARYTPAIQKISNGLGFLIALAYSSIPVYVLMHR